MPASPPPPPPPPSLAAGVLVIIGIGVPFVALSSLAAPLALMVFCAPAAAATAAALRAAGGI